MEATIPPRDHLDQEEKNSWDDNNIFNSPHSRPSQQRTKPRLTRQTVQWPFQSISIEDNTYTRPPIPQSPSSSTITSPEEVHLPPRSRATWQPRRGAAHGYGYGDDSDDDGDESDKKSTLRRSLIPDYVINYLRGETPETLAQRKIERQREKESQSQENLVGAGVSRGGGSRSSQVNGLPMPSPGYRRSDEPMLVRNGDYYNSEKRRSYGTTGGGLRRRQNKRRGLVAHGWRAGVALYGVLALVIFVVSLACLVVALTVLRRDGGRMSMAILFTSDVVPVTDAGSTSCASARPVAWLLRAIVAMFSVALLAGAQYAFQILSSPTRAELDAAHARRQWLDIGVPSLRNVGFLLGQRKARVVLALVVVAVAVASTVLYSALINVVLVAPLSVASAPSYNVLLVTPSFLDGSPFSNASSNNAGGLDRVTILQLQQLAVSSQQQTLTNLTAAECLQSQSQSSASTMSAVEKSLALFGINDDTNNNTTSSRSTGSFSAVLIVLTDAAADALQTNNGSVAQTAPAGSELLAADASLGSSSSMFQITTGGDDGSDRSAFVVDEAAVAFCLVQEKAAATTTDDTTAATTCNVTLSTTILSAVVGLNIVTVLSFAYLLLPRKAHRHFRQAPLITLGDAVASFLRDPDPTTRGACLLSKTDVVQHGVWKSMVNVPHLPGFGPYQESRQSTESNGTGQSAQQPENVMQPMFLEAPADEGVNSSGKRSRGGSSYFWFQSVSLTRWFTGAVAWWVVVGLALAAVVVTVSNSNDLGAFGQISPLSSAVYGTSSSSTPISWMTPTALLGSLPQLGVAVLYLLVDTHLSAYFLSHESAQYVAAHQHCRRPLRVSYHPRGHQTTSLYLALPQPFHWALVVVAAGLIFAVGESVVATGVTSPDNSVQLALLGFSGVGSVVVLVLLAGLALLVLVLGARRTPPPNASLGRNPLVLPGGSCSAVISARCHPMPEEMPAELTGLNGSKSGPLPLWLRPLAWGPVPAYHHPYQGYNRRRGLTREVVLRSDGTVGSVDEDNIDAIVGHCAFSSGPLMPLDTARSYA